MGTSMHDMNKNIEIKLVAAFKGVTFIPSPFVLGHNNINPKLILKEQGIEFKNLFFTQEKQYSEIKEVTIFINNFKLLGVKTTNVCLSFNNSVFTFIGNLNDEKKLRELLALFKKKGCNLTSEAQFFLEQQPKD